MLRALVRFVPKFVPPDLLTALSLPFSILFLYYSWKGDYFVALAFLALSSLMDALDGALARATNRTSIAGAFLDSSIDRVNDVVMAGALPAIGVPWFIAFLWASGSLVTSSLRAAAEADGVRGEGVGVMERGDRILALFIIFIIKIVEDHMGLPTPKYSVAVTVGVTALIWITVVQRTLLYGSLKAMWTGFVETSIVIVSILLGKAYDVYGFLGVTGVLAYLYLILKWISLGFGYPANLYDPVLDSLSLFSLVWFQGAPFWLFYFVRLLTYYRLLRGRRSSSTPSRAREAK